MKLKHLGSFLLMAVMFGFSCTSYKQVPYFQDIRRDTLTTESINNYTPFTLQPGDLIGINVNSQNHQADLVYNYNLVQDPQNFGVGLPSEGQDAVIGYLVDNDGNIKLPNIGLVNVNGLSTKEAAARLETKLQTYLTQPIVNVRILNFKISVLGDVKNPGVYAVKNEKVSVVDALSLAGDLNTTGMRKTVLLIREKDGKREYIPIDLTSRKLFSASYFYLKNGDVLYVQPNKAKTFADESLTARIGTILAAISVLILALKR